MTQSEAILNQVGAEIAQRLNVRYNGFQVNVNEIFVGHMFTDPQTGSSFMGRDAVHAQKRLMEVRETFSSHKSLHETML